MPYTAITTQAASVDGAIATFTAIVSGAGNGVEFANDGTAIVQVVNGTAGALTLTMRSNYAAAGLTLPDKTVVLGASVTRHFRIPSSPFNNANGLTRLEASATGLTVAVLQ